LFHCAIEIHYIDHVSMAGRFGHLSSDIHNYNDRLTLEIARIQCFYISV